MDKDHKRTKSASRNHSTLTTAQQTKTGKANKAQPRPAGTKAGQPTKAQPRPKGSTSQAGQKLEKAKPIEAHTGQAGTASADYTQRKP